MTRALLTALAAAALCLTARPAAAQISVTTADIRDWGCKVDPGDFSTDSGPCISKAWAARPDIYIPAGNWHLRSKIRCPQNGSMTTAGTYATIFTVGSPSNDFTSSDGVLQPGVPGLGHNCAVVGGFRMVFYQPTAPASIADIVHYPPAILGDDIQRASFSGEIVIENAWDCVQSVKTPTGPPTPPGTGTSPAGLYLSMVKCSSYDVGLKVDGPTSEDKISWDQETWGMNTPQVAVYRSQGNGVGGQAYAAKIGQCDVCMIDITAFVQPVLFNAAVVSAPGLTIGTLHADGANVINSSVNPVRIAAGYINGAQLSSTLASASLQLGTAFKIGDAGTTATTPCYSVNVIHGYVQMAGRYQVQNAALPSICATDGFLKIANTNFIMSASARTAPAILISGTAELDYDDSNIVQYRTGISGPFLEIDNDNPGHHVEGTFKGYGVALPFVDRRLPAPGLLRSARRQVSAGHHAGLCQRWVPRCSR